MITVHTLEPLLEQWRLFLEGKILRNEYDRLFPSRMRERLQKFKLTKKNSTYLL